MYDKNLERFIEVCLADGVLTQREKDAIRKKAEAMGVSGDEILVYAEGRLDELRSSRSGREEDAANECPKCGATIPTMAMSCPDCGYEIRYDNVSDALSKFSERYAAAQYDSDKCDVLESFLVPNNRESILEFLAMALPNVVKPKKPSMAAKIALILIGGLLIIIMLALCSSDIAISCAAGGFFMLLAAFVVIFHNVSNTDLDNAWDAKLRGTLLKADMLRAADAEYTAKVNTIADAYRRHLDSLRYRRYATIALYVIVVALIVTVIIIGHNFSNAPA